MPGFAQRRFNDAQLRDAELLVEDPLSYPGLTYERPAEGFEPKILAEYHLPSDKQVRCSYCDQRQHHQHGFISEFAPGSCHLIGSECGQAKLNMHFQTEHRAHKDAMSRKSYLLRLDFVAERAKVLIAECDGILRSDALRHFEATGEILEKVAGDLMIRLRSNSGPLYENVPVRDLASETEEDEKNGRQRFKNERVMIGQLRGRGILYANGLRLRIKALKDAIRAAASLQRSDTDPIETTKLKSTIKALDEAHNDANAAIGEITGGFAFFTPENIKLIESWARSNSSVEVVADGSTLVVNGVKISLPKSDAPESVSAVRH